MVHKRENLIQKIKGKNYGLFINTVYEDKFFFDIVKKYKGIPLGNKALIPLDNIHKFAKRLTQPID